MNDTYSQEGALKDTQFLDMSWIDSSVRSWCQQKGHESVLSGSNSIDVFRKRSSVSAFRVAALCYYLYQKEGIAEAKAKKYCKQIYLFMAEYIIQALIKRWGKTFEDLNAKRYSEQTKLRDPGIFALLNDDFTRDQLKLLVQQQGRTTPARMFIYMWQQSGDIVSIDKDHFRKVKPKK